MVAAGRTVVGEGVTTIGTTLLVGVVTGGTTTVADVRELATAGIDEAVTAVDDRRTVGVEEATGYWARHWFSKSDAMIKGLAGHWSV